MNDLLPAVLDHLAALVAYDTRNPPRRIDANGVFAYLRQHLPGFSCTLTDGGEGCISLLAVRGRPDMLFNFHLDTVPATSHWSQDPLEMRIDGERAIGLGACDIKGAAACMLTAAQNTRGDLALLFSSDEEAGSSRCVRDFLATDHGFCKVIVAEPTSAEGVLAHRGVVTASVRFRGIGGHTSERRALDDSAVHRAVAWAGKVLVYAVEHERSSYEELSGLRLNIGRIEGGIKANMIAPDAEIHFGIRPLPQQDGERILSELRALIPDEHLAEWRPAFAGPSLPAANPQPGEVDPLAESRSFAEALGVPIGGAVDFWTEAAIFSAAGLTAIVFGPGHIAQAHTADEWVELSQLRAVLETYIGVICDGRG